MASIPLNLGVSNMPKDGPGTYDFDSAIRARLGNIQQAADSATSWSNFQAQKRKNAQQIADAQSMYDAQQQGQNANAGWNAGNYTSGSAGGGGDMFQRFKHAIALQESGDNFNPTYYAGNPYNAIGKYSILASAVPAWSKQALGYSVTPAQFKASPQIQEAVATYHLQRLYNAYGAAGAAVAWYAGEGTAKKWVAAGGGGKYNAGQAGGYPSINAYVKKLLARM